ncbi:DcrB-related protein [Chondromyces crocatus]|uniref:DUF1795 domain-containing protein n=1 Tax=Chondromyces crocatus TaxID=52 RepID=A0A0K1ENN7_CHOCO|nr:DcrB-related protein [Chondromyces crocatus]AKT42213.1 uncharacterized protein CMC5_064360 [Chondromyces crocatus]
MPIYHTDEISFEVPEGFDDRSLTVLSPTGEPAISLVITREPRTDAPLATQVSQVLEAMLKQVPGSKVTGQRERTMGGLAAREVRTTTAANKILLYARQVFVSYYGTLLTMTVTTKRAHQSFCDRAVESLADSIKFRKR